MNFWVIMDLYQQELMDHYRNPRNRGHLEHADFVSREHNPSCGDAIAMEGVVENGVIKKLVFTGQGCVISQATGSLLTQACCGKSLDEIMQLGEPFIRQLLGIELGPTRLRCALLALQALQQGIHAYQTTGRQEK